MKDGAPTRQRAGAPLDSMLIERMQAAQAAWERTGDDAELCEWIRYRKLSEAYYFLEWERWTRPLNARELLIATLEGWL